jgi:tetratricopeptide (TPR) repeat protein
MNSAMDKMVWMNPGAHPVRLARSAPVPGAAMPVKVAASTFLVPQPLRTLLRPGRAHSGGGILFLALIALLAPARLMAAEADSAAAARQAFQRAKARSQSEPTNVQAGWQFGRACFDLAEFATNNAQRAELAQEGISACQRALAQASNSAPAHYYLGLNLGQLARTKNLGALKLVTQMEAEWNMARAADERLDYGGPDRSLGLLYRDAPTIASIGSRTKAREHLQRALDLASDYPENWLNLIETELNWGNRKDAARDLKSFEEVLPSARKSFPATDWAANWHDWDKRLQKLRKTLEEPSKVLESPRAKG